MIDVIVNYNNKLYDFKDHTQTRGDLWLAALWIEHSEASSCIVLLSYMSMILQNDITPPLRGLHMSTRDVM